MDRDMQRGSDLNRCILYFFIYCPLGSLCPLIGQYLSSIGFSGTQVGIITSLGTGAAILAGLLWGKIYANIDKKRWLIISMCMAAAGLGLLSSTTAVFAAFALIYSMMYAFQGPVYGLTDSFVISKSNNFPVIRATGAAGYAVAAFAVGKLAGSSGLVNIFYIYAAAFMITAILMIRESDPPVYREKTKKIKMGHLMRDKKFVKLLICAFLLTGTSVANNTYFSYLFIEGGGTIAGVGTAFLLMTGSEAPMMALAPWLSRKIGIERLILICGVIMVGRFALYASGPGYGILLGTFFLQGTSQGVILVEIVRYFNKIVPPEMSGMAISVYYALGNNLSVIVCSFMGGIALDLTGARGVYVFFALINAGGVILYWLMGMYRDEGRAEA